MSRKSSVTVKIEFPTVEAYRFFQLLNDDCGLRDNAADRLIYHEGPELDRLYLVRVLGRISAAFHAALDDADALNTEGRKRDLQKLAFRELHLEEKKSNASTTSSGDSKHA